TYYNKVALVLNTPPVICVYPPYIHASNHHMVAAENDFEVSRKRTFHSIIGFASPTGHRQYHRLYIVALAVLYLTAADPSRSL
ncbi:hypothetical protein, partial [Thiolapillus sp.]|uniref:hypothetical protein n=1 Tax=Thiolapillus sp. TaxID=2017437 RepID=UPI003AF4D640